MNVQGLKENVKLDIPILDSIISDIDEAVLTLTDIGARLETFTTTSFYGIDSIIASSLSTRGLDSSRHDQTLRIKIDYLEGILGNLEIKGTGTLPYFLTRTITNYLIPKGFYDTMTSMSISKLLEDLDEGLALTIALSNIRYVIMKHNHKGGVWKHVWKGRDRSKYLVVDKEKLTLRYGSDYESYSLEDFRSLCAVGVLGIIQDKKATDGVFVKKITEHNESQVVYFSQEAVRYLNSPDVINFDRGIQWGK